MAIFLEIPAITQCRVLIAEGSDASLREAENKLRECLQLSQTQHNTFQMTGIMVLQALATQKQGRTDEAMAVLEKAVELAKPGVHSLADDWNKMVAIQWHYDYYDRYNHYG